MEEKRKLYEVDGIELNSLWFADDNMQVSKSKKAAKHNIRVIKEIFERLRV